jgi:hypothetical protein
MTRINSSFSGSNMYGMYAEFEFTYSGTKQIEIDMPIVINPERKT